MLLFENITEKEKCVVSIRRVNFFFLIQIDIVFFLITIWQKPKIYQRDRVAYL